MKNLSESELQFQNREKTFRIGITISESEIQFQHLKQIENRNYNFKITNTFSELEVPLAFSRTVIVFSIENMAFCKKCGTAVNHKFCGKCGEKVEVDNKVYWFGIVFMFYIRTTLLTEKVNKFKQNTTTLTILKLNSGFHDSEIVIPILKDFSRF